MPDPTLIAPAVHLVLLGPAVSEWEKFVGFGAEEEGVPVRTVRASADEPVAAAYEAARGSVFGIGLALAAEQIVLHESHMPPEQPVMSAALGAIPAKVARRFGGNAARMVVRLPLRLADEPETSPETSETSEDEVRRIVALVVARMSQRRTK